jgi:hypothetical protein
VREITIQANKLTGLNDALADGRAGIGLVRTVLLSELARSFESREVHALKDLLVQALGAVAVERHAQLDKGVRETLHTDTDGPVAEVGLLGLGHGVVVDVDNLVKVLGDNLGHLAELGKVVVVLVNDKGRERDGSQVADGNLVGRGVLDDFGAEVAALDGAQVLLVALAVAAVLVEHVRVAGLDLRLEDGGPELLSLDDLASHALLLVLVEECLDWQTEMHG